MIVATTDADALSVQLARGAKAMDLALGDTAHAQLIALVELLAKWNRAYNLTAITDPPEIVAKHLLDSLSLLPFAEAQHLLDVGTGAGFPGLPLAIMRPQQDFTLLDSSAKKLRFIDQACAELCLENVTTAHARVESFESTAPFDAISCRAFASLARVVSWVDHLLAPGGRILAMKGHIDADEQSAVADDWRVVNHPVVVPFVDGARHIVELTRRDRAP
ncbi:MAG: 16S rRNA (guanine(527)-N(7))-methyltransferase RsmG [Pseudomonadota bacterium]